MTFIQCQNGRYINAEYIENFNIEGRKTREVVNGKLVCDVHIVAKSSSTEYFLGRYPIEQVDNVIEQLIGHLATNRNYKMPDFKGEIYE